MWRSTGRPPAADTTAGTALRGPDQAGRSANAADAAGLSQAVARIWDAFQAITAVGSPLALGTAMLFYFGWSRSQAQARAFGADVSVFEMSPNDFVLRSID